MCCFTSYWYLDAGTNSKSCLNSQFCCVLMFLPLLMTADSAYPVCLCVVGIVYERTKLSGQLAVIEKTIQYRLEYKLICYWLSVVDGFSTRLIHGMTLNPVTLNWSWISNTSVNYALHAVKSAETDSWTDSWCWCWESGIVVQIMIAIITQCH